jgi:hypothetical protein
MKEELVFILLLVFTLPSAHSQELDQRQLAEILSCIKQEGPELGSPLPRFDTENVLFRYRVGEIPLRYPSGQVVSQDAHNEMRIAVYGPEESSLIIYDLFLESKKDGIVTIQIGNPASFMKHNGQWVAGDNPGGMATGLFLRTLVNDFSIQAPHMLRLTDLAASQNISCSR